MVKISDDLLAAVRAAQAAEPFVREAERAFNRHSEWVKNVTASSALLTVGREKFLLGERLLEQMDAMHRASRDLARTYEPLIAQVTAANRMFGSELTASFRTTLEQLSVVPKALAYQPAIGGLGLIAPKIDWIAPLIGTTADAFSSELARLSTIVEAHRRAVLEAPDEPTRRQEIIRGIDTTTTWVKDALAGTLDGSIQLVFPLNVRSVAKFLGFVIFTLLMLQSSARDSERRERAHSREIADLRREHARTIAVLSAAIQDILDKPGTSDALPTIILEVSRYGRLRVAPDGETELVATLKVGTRLRFLQFYERWRYVEVLDGSDRRGWIYQRNVRLAR